MEERRRVLEKHLYRTLKTTCERWELLRPGERVMGLERGRTLELDQPQLFTFTCSEGERGVPVRAIQLPYGTQWTWSLPVPAAELYDDQDLPMPVVSAECVALAYRTRRAGGGSSAVTTVVFLDKKTGKRVDTVSDLPALGSARSLSLRGLGDTLFVLGTGSTPRGTSLEILEEMR